MSANIQRCAIYTRKSSEEGLEQEFNSLDAQREACEAYIKSQQHEGWRVIETCYDDGGLSGGSMDRPAIQRLLSDIKAGLIDTVVVYKVDRLTRALPDFAKMVDIFDAHEVSFVSVTQSFNTTSSMGRLTLNVLLSFAQFEREVTAERIRDKIAASRRKGMWMGGAVPLGYIAKDKALHIEPKGAKLVRLIYDRYAALGSVKAVRAELATTKSAATPDCAGNKTQSPGFSHGALYWILRNPIYCGDVRHKQKIYPGQHKPIIPREEWDRVQKLLDTQGGGTRNGARRKTSRILSGIVFDQDGQLLKTSFAVRSVKTKEGPARKRYWYYQAAQQDVANADTGGRKALRIPADEFERIVIEILSARLRDRSWIASAMCGSPQAIQSQNGCAAAAGVDTATIEPPIAVNHLPDALERAEALAARIEQLPESDTPGTDELIRALIQRIDLGPNTMTLSMRAGCLAAHHDEPLTEFNLPPISVPIHMRQFGRNKPIIISTDLGEANRDADLIAMIADARRWLGLLRSADAISIDALTKSEGKANGVISRMLPLAFLAPDITSAILSGTQPRSLTATTIRDAHPIPACWNEQRAALGFDPH